jgi:hypothetical protein
MTRVAYVEGLAEPLYFADDTPDDVIQRVVMENLGKNNAGTPHPGAESAAPPAAAEPPAPVDAPPAPPAGNGLNPERAAMYAQEKGLLDRLKREIGEAGIDLKNLGSAAVRPIYQAATTTLLPFDVAHSAERFIREGDYSPTAARKAFVWGPVDQSTPSMQAQAWLDAHTTPPTDTMGRVSEAISSGLVGARVPGMPRVAPGPMAPPSADAVIAAGKKHNVPVYFDDVTKSAFAKKLGVGAENVPLVGTSAGRARQGEAAKEAAKTVAARFAEDVADDVPTVMQKGLEDQLNVFRGEAGKRYTHAAQLLDQAAEVVPTPRFVLAIRRELLNQKNLGSAANKDVVALLQKYQQAPEGNFTLARQLRSQLKGEIREFYRGGENKAIGEQGVERLREMREALEADMEDFATQAGGAAHEAWKNADEFYKTNLLPFKERGFAELVKTAEPEKAWRYLMTQGGIESRVERMYNGLNDSGRAAVRSGVVADAMEHALGPKGTFSPAKFAKYMEDHRPVIDKFFHGADKEEINGFTNLMRHVERAGQYMENPPTGQRLIGAMMIGSTALSLKPLLIGAGAAGGTRVLFQTQRGRDLLLAASRLKPGSPGMNIMGNRIGRLMVSGAATSYRQNRTEEPTEEMPEEPAEVSTEPVAE